MAVRITLFCNAGMSTSLIVKRMQEASQAQGKDYEIAAYGLADVQKKAPEADVILVGPQIRHAINLISEYAPATTPVHPIDMRMYGMMDAKGILCAAEKLLREKHE